MEYLMKKIELLAPAKDLECGIAAIDCGADAVYIGALSFGAREAAGNNLTDIAELVDCAHKYWAKVYVTVNILLHDREIDSVLELISQLYEIHIDGLIIQDVGLLECDLPPIPIIASTQMHNDTPEKVAFLESVGIRRAILARELDLDQIKAIRRQTDIELECFVHGSLCVCYSGQCYLSYALGGRSGNRGKCAQPCRKLYSLVDGDSKTLARNKHLLSIRDLNLSAHLRELIEAGVTSLKIEGRLKDKGYVANVVAHYRAQLDLVLAELGLNKSSSGRSRIDFEPDVNKTFNRGYTSYFLHGKGGKIGSIDTPKMLGEAIGKVIRAGRKSVIMDSNIPMHPGDGICFYDRYGNLRGTVVNGVQGNAIFPDKPEKIEEGTIIYRNHDHEFLTRLSKSHPQRLISVALVLKETSDALVLSAKDEDGNFAEFSLACEKTPAQKPDSAVANIQKQLTKSGGTDFECSEVTIELSEVPFVPISTLNTLRRGVLEKLACVRVENRPVCSNEIEQNEIPYPQSELSYLNNVLNRCADEFYKFHGVTSIEPAAESGLDMKGRKMMTTRYCLKHQLDLCPKDNKSMSSVGPLSLIDEEGHKLELRFNCSKCEMEVFLDAST